MNEPQGLIAVWLDVAAERDGEFNDWYNLEHLPQVVALDGFVCARRYVTDKIVPRYLAWYETIDAAVETAPGFRHLVAHPTPWSTRMRRFYGENRIRNNYRLAWSSGPAPQTDAPWLYTVQTDISDPAQETEFNAWYAEEHLPRLAAVPGVLRTRRYVAVSGGPRSMSAFELAAREVFESPAWIEARETPWTAKMRKLFCNTRRPMYRLVHGTVRHDALEQR